MRFDLVDGNILAQAAYIGIDQSLTATGIAIITSNNAMVVSTLSPKTKGPVRLAGFRDAFAALWALPLLRFVAIEGYSFGSKFQAHQMGELGGLLRVGLLDAKKPSVAVTPTQVKKFLAGGGLKKNMMVKEVFKQYGLEVDNDNEADAAVLACIARAVDTRLVRSQREREVLDNLELLTPRSPPAARLRVRR